jgi:hypothetical protein
MEGIWVVSVVSNNPEMENDMVAFRSREKAIEKRNEYIEDTRSCLGKDYLEVGECSFNEDEHSLFIIEDASSDICINIMLDIVKLY